MIIGPFLLEIIVTFLVVAYLLQKYGNCRKHHILVTANVFIAWYFSFIIIVILPLDVSSTAYRQCLKNNVAPTVYPYETTTIVINSSEISNTTAAGQNGTLQESAEYSGLSSNNDCKIPWSHVSDEVLQCLWRIVYWSAQTLTWIILPMMQSYSTAGDFTISGKLKTALVENAIYYGSYLLIFGTLLIYVVLQPNSNLSGSNLKVICITASNTWGLFLLVLLEGYGLVEIPRRLWNTTKKGYMLNLLYFKASKVSAERCEAEEKVDDLTEEITHISNTTSSNHPTRPLVDLILEKLPAERKSITQFSGRSADDRHFSIDGISERGLAKLHKQIIRAIHMYRRTQCQWNMLLEQVFHWEDIVQNENNRDRFFKSSLGSSRSYLMERVCNPKLDWYWNCLFRNWVYRTLCIVLSVLSIIVVWSELTFFTQNPTLSLFALFIKSARNNYNYIAIEIISTATIAYLCVCAYYTVFRIRILNLYYLAPHHQTNEYSLIFCGMLLCRLTPPLCLNFLGLIHLDSHVTKNSNIEETSYTKIMGHMDVIPIISDGFNIYFPILIFFVCLATYFNICSRVLHFIGFEQFIGDDEMTSDLVEEGRELVKREKNRRQRLETKELRRRQTGRPVSVNSARTGKRQGTRDTNLTGSSPDENSRIELLKDVEPVDYTEERNRSPDFPQSLQQEEFMGEDGNTYLRSSWSRIGRPPAGIFDDV